MAKNLAVSFKEIHVVDSIIQRISVSAGNAATISENTRNSVIRGRSCAQDAITRVSMIQVASAEVSTAISELLRLSSEIEAIVGLISNIADQTSLLALNASIEAARAGEHGRGFAVVAAAVGELASNSTDAADSVSVLIREVQVKIQDADMAMARGLKEVDEGVIIIGEVGETFDDLLGEARESSKEVAVIADEVSNVSGNSTSLVKSIEDISSIADESAANIEGISLVSQDQFVSTEEIFANAKSLANIVEALNSQLTGFQRNVYVEEQESRLVKI